MKDRRDLIRYGLATGTLAALVLLVVLAFGRTSTGGGAADPTANSPLRAENARLQAQVDQLQQREVEFRRQIEQANATIDQLNTEMDLLAVPQFAIPSGDSAQLNRGVEPGEGFFFFFPDHDERQERHEHAELGREQG